MDKTKKCISDVNQRTVAGKVFLSAFVGFLSCSLLSILKKGTEKSLNLNASSVEELPLTAATRGTIRREPY